MNSLFVRYIPNVIYYLPEMGKAIHQTLVTVGLAAVFATLIGIPLGLVLVVTRPDHVLPHRTLNRTLSSMINLFRSTPFIILLVALLPITRSIVGTTIGVRGAIVPLVFASAPYIGRMVENALLEVDRGVIEAAQAMGSTPWQIMIKVLLPEAFPALILALAVAIVNLIGYSATAGVVGGGGLGDFAIRYGYQNFKTDIMVVTVLLLSVMVQGVHILGERAAASFRRN